MDDRHEETVADICSLSWVNTIFSAVWPKVHLALTEFVHAELTPRLQDVLPTPFKQVHFARFSLGDGLPQLGPVEVMKHSEGHIQVEVDFKYFSETDVLLDAGRGISFGIRRLSLAGRLCLAMKPLLEKWPLVGGVHFFFASQPKVELKYQGLGDFPGLAQKVQDAVDGMIRSAIVLPNFKSFDFTDNESKFGLEANAQRPLGVLRVRILRARNLAGANLQLTSEVERFSSDPYCVIRLGSQSVRSSTTSGSVSPAWPPDEPSVFLVVHHHEQEVEIDVMHEPRGKLRPNFVTLLGKMPATSVRTLLHRAEIVRSDESDAGGFIRQRRVVLDTSAVNKTMLHVKDPVNIGVPSEIDLCVEWFDLAAGPGSFSRRDRSLGLPEGLILVELMHGFNFPAEAIARGRGPRWQCRLVSKDSPRTAWSGKHTQSKFGECVCEEFRPGASVPRILFGVIDRLYEEDGLHHEDIAHIVDLGPDIILQYLKERDTFRSRLQEKRQLLGEDMCGEFRWHQTLTLFFSKDAREDLAIDLIDPDGLTIGTLENIDLRELIEDESGAMPCTRLQLRPAESDQEEVRSRLAAWIFPYCSKPVHAKSARTRYRAVQMEVSLRLLRLTTGSAPWTVTAAATVASSDSPSRMDPGVPRSRPSQPGLPPQTEPKGDTTAEGVVAPWESERDDANPAGVTASRTDATHSGDLAECSPRPSSERRANRAASPSRPTSPSWMAGDAMNSYHSSGYVAVPQPPPPSKRYDDQ